MAIVANPILSKGDYPSRLDFVMIGLTAVGTHGTGEAVGQSLLRSRAVKMTLAVRTCAVGVGKYVRTAVTADFEHSVNNNELILEDR
jgi:hypothetical protein